jgi:hypothetical protein
MDRPHTKENLKFAMVCITKAKAHERFLMAVITILNDLRRHKMLMDRIGNID